MADTITWNFYGNTGGLAVKSKYLQQAPVLLNPDQGAEFVASTPAETAPTQAVPSAPSAPVDTYN